MGVRNERAEADRVCRVSSCPQDKLQTRKPFNASEVIFEFKENLKGNSTPAQCLKRSKDLFFYWVDKNLSYDNSQRYIAVYDKVV